jgi:hypothetical protein
MTVFDPLLNALQKAGDYNRGNTVPPADMLWPDAKRERESLVPRTWGVLPQFLVFGPYPSAPPISAHELRLGRFASQGGWVPPYPRNPSDAHKAPNNPRRSS